MRRGQPEDSWGRWRFLGRPQRDGGVPEEERPLAEAGEGESEGFERAEELLEERSEAEG
jgi:hypothetical protein